jgi:hypothetical protein
MDFFPIQTYPKTVRIALYSMLAAWACFLWTLYQYDALEYISRFAIAAALLLFFLLRLKNWARMICLCANALAILYCSFGLYLATRAAPNGIAAFFSALSVLLFLINTYYLLVKPTREFYKQAEPPGSGPFPTESAPSPKKK